MWCYFYIIFYSLHCPLSGPDLTYISLLIIPCIIYYVTNKETLNLQLGLSDVRLPLCDKWGGAESRGNGARPVEQMIMSDTYTTYRSQVPRRSSGRIKGGATRERQERNRPEVLFCVFCAAVVCEGTATFILCLFILLLKCFKRSPVPASFFPI